MWRYGALWGTLVPLLTPWLPPPGGSPPADYTKVISTMGRCVLLWGAIEHYGALCVAMGHHRAL